MAVSMELETAGDADADRNIGDDSGDEGELDTEEMVDLEVVTENLASAVSIQAAELRAARAEGRLPSEEKLPLWAQGHSVLHLVCICGNEAHVLELLDAHADPNMRYGDSGSTLLHVVMNSPYAEDEQKVTLAKLLIERKADPMLKDAEDKAPADSTYNDELRKVLGAQSTCLLTGAMQRDADKLLSGLDEIKADSTGTKSLELLDRDGWTALHLAAYRPASECATLLIQARASVNVLTKDTRQSPLHLAARSGSFDIAKRLIEALADVHSYEADQEHDWEFTNKSYKRDPKKHKQPLHLASEVANVLFMRILLDAAADVNAKDSFECTPLHLAIENAQDADDELPPSAGVRIINGAGSANGQFGAIVGCREVCQDAACADPNCAQHADERQFPVLVEGSSCELTLKNGNVVPARLAAVDLLLEARADVNIGNRKIGMGQSMLHEAVRVGDLPMAKRAIKHGAALNQRRESSGYSALHFAARAKNVGMIKLLRHARADITITDDSGKTPIDLAASNRLTADVAAALLDGPAMQSLPSACLVAAASIGDLSLVKASIEAKAAVDLISKDRFARLQCAMQSRNQEMVKLLTEAGYTVSRKRPLDDLYLN
eukprot:TRINITY_DN26906_c0_g1_i1.p1 TRINITY_DN26906_c0_g1~~TRINITY_DN26906_c0_g1_i1.p1  ORF type:complete len:607 (+),score=113.71 TRINITY_DN26906_c0_g1_i1:38-1858(+)